MHRPSVVISLEDGIGHGSARSIENYHLLQGLDSCAELFEQYGGHAAAAGMKIKAENIDKLREKLNEHAVKNLSDEDLIPEIKIDALVSSQTLDLQLVEEIKLLEPFGAGNPKPIFATKDLYLTDEPFVMKEKHLKLKLADKAEKDLKQFGGMAWKNQKSKLSNPKPASN